MEQESTLISNKTIAIIGGGPAGCICAKFLQNFGFKEINIFDFGTPLRTILPTGGGRCNITHAIYDFRDLTKNYPRGEKFLYSIFSKFSVQDTIDFFKSIGVNIYTQEDGRIFPQENSSSFVREKILKSLKCNFIKEKVENIEKIANGYKIETNKSTYAFDIVIISIGGHAGYSIFNNLEINIIEPTQSLVGLHTKEDYSSIAGVSIKNCTIGKEAGDIIFTHKGISGPLIYTISSYEARKKMPYNLSIKLAKIENFQDELNNNPHKDIKNLISNYIPKSLSEYILKKLKITPETKCHSINGILRDKIKNQIENFNITIISKVPDGEVVTCGGVDLNEINPKTLEFKKYPNMFAIGEVLDIDGLCGGFNLQNCWSGAFVAASAIKEKENLH